MIKIALQWKTALPTERAGRALKHLRIARIAHAEMPAVAVAAILPLKWSGPFGCLALSK